jgi:hypothetical protein
MSSAADWVVIKYDVQPPVLKCERCGATQVLALPMSVSFFVGGVEAWAFHHRYCEDPRILP